MIGSLRVALGLDTAQFASGATKAKGIATSLSSSMKGLFAGMVAGLSLAGITSALKSSVDHMDELGKVAQKIGIPVDELSKLEYAAKLSDVSLEALQGSVGRLARNLSEIAGGGKNDAGYALQALGIKAVDANGKLRPTSAILQDVADKFAGYRDGANKTALAVDLFGKSGADMIPLLNGGADAIRAAGDELDRMGGVVTPQAAAQAEILNDNMTRVHEVFQGVTTRIASSVLPTFNDLVAKFVDAEGGAEALEGALAGGLKAAMVEITRTAIEMKEVFFEVGKVWEFLTVPLPEGAGLSDYAARWREIMAEVSSSAADTKKRVEDLYSTINGTQSGDGKQSITNSAGLKPEAPSGEATHRRDAAATRDNAKAERELQRAAEERGRTIEQIFNETRTPLERFQLEMAKLNELFKNGKENPELYARAVKKLQDDFAATAKVADDTAKKIEDSFTSAFDSWIDQAIDGTFNLKNALNDLLGDLTKLLLHQAFQSLLNPDVAPSQQGGGGLFGMIGNLIGGLFGPSSIASPQAAISNKAARSSGPAGALTFQVINNAPNVAVRQNEVTGPDGKRIIQAIVDERLAGQLPKALQSGYGITPNMRRR
jgi:hypothetical protein